MGETTDEGASSAARSARGDDNRQDRERERRRGLLGWLFGGAGEDEHPEAGANGAASVARLLDEGSVGHLRRLRVDDVSIPRAEIVSVPVDIALPDLVAVFRDSGLTRLPVYDGSLDNPVGMIHLKDVALRYGFNGRGGAFELRPLLRPLLYAPPSMPISVLLQKMQTERRHMALVIDEYGGVDGLVTIEDLIEQIVGEITDEHDIDDEQNWVVEKPGVYLALARTPLEELEAEIGLSLVDEDEDEEIDTLGGLVFLLSGRVPARGEVIPHPGGPEFEVVDADPRRIKRVRVRVHPQRPV